LTNQFCWPYDVEKLQGSTMAALPPLNALRAFEASARHLNFRLAAEDLGVTQGAVAQQVRGLEARLAVTLFDRLPRGLALSGDRQITISVTPSFASKWLVPRLPDFTRHHPDIAVQVDARERLADFQGDGVDIAVRQGRAPFGSGVVAVPLFSTTFVPVCGPEMAARIAHPADLTKHTLLNDTHGLWPLFLQRAGITGKPKMMSFSQTSLAIDAAVSGQGVALANEPLVSAQLAAGQLVRPIPDELVEDLGFYIVTPKQPRQPALVAVMKDWLLSQS
jgi:LysR family glycine cleavage system transcriptional activator